MRVTQNWDCSFNHRPSGKAISIEKSYYPFVALVTQNAVRLIVPHCVLLYCHLWHPRLYYICQHYLMTTDYGLDSPRSNPRGEEIFPPVQTDPDAHPASCKMGIGSFPGVKCGRGVLLTTLPLLVPRSWKSRAIPLRTLWATTGLYRENFYYFHYTTSTIHSSVRNDLQFRVTSSYQGNTRLGRGDNKNEGVEQQKPLVPLTSI